MLTGKIRFYEEHSGLVKTSESPYVDVPFSLHVGEIFRERLYNSYNRAAEILEKAGYNQASLGNYHCIELYADGDELNKIYAHLPDSLKFKTLFFEVAGDMADNIFRNCIYYNWNIA